MCSSMALSMFVVPSHHPHRLVPGRVYHPRRWWGLISSTPQSPLPPALGRACWDGFTHRRTMSRAASSGVLSSLCAVVAAPTHPHPWHLYTPVLAVEAHTWDGRHGLTGKAHLREDGRPGGNGHMLRKVGVTHELVLSGELDEYITHTHTHTPQSACG